MKNLLLSIYITIIAFNFTLADNRKYIHVKSKFSNVENIITKGDLKVDITTITKGYQKSSTLNVGGAEVLLFTKGDKTLLVTQQFNKYGWVIINSDSKQLGMIIRELILNIYNSH
ncbi:hypothetical protein EI427_19570 [Flammeovirga pectinis]|uniref:Uncharacterized protein n=1 Tax=Flammeovirga pectinis TaxID=2494373 RepID=A0A3Q9FTL3_9BACT|nr:hypothetical protein [Flammeovirga pectinis]AZQ64331.1 hypothetical protein EI427_19570 [Flammeovirga pectinis]